ncbi:MAG: DUF4149 domain-containing protein [Chthoniobacterales bacterium]
MKPSLFAGLFRWACGFGEGVMIFFTFGVALPLFKILPRETAGATTVQLFPNYYYCLLGILGIALIAALVIVRQHRLNWISLLLVAVALACILFTALYLAPLIQEMKTPATMDTFRKLHGISMLLNLLSMISILAAPILIRTENTSHEPMDIIGTRRSL